MRRYEIGYALRASGQNITRHPMALFASVTTVTLMLLLMSVYILVTMNAAHIVTLASQQPPIQVIMKNGVSAHDVEGVEALLKDDPRVERFESFTPEQNLAEFMIKMHKDKVFDDQSLAKVLPYTLNIKLNDPKATNEIVQTLKSAPGVYKVTFQQALTAWFERFSRLVNKVGIGAFVVLGLISILVVSNMVRISVLLRADEIGIMKYVGATNAYIRVPFVVEGIVVGLFGAFVASLVSGLIYHELAKRYVGLPASLLGASADRSVGWLATGHVVWIVLMLNLAIGVGLCVVASAISVKRHVKV